MPSRLCAAASRPPSPLMHKAFRTLATTTGSVGSPAVPCGVSRCSGAFTPARGRDPRRLHRRNRHFLLSGGLASGDRQQHARAHQCRCDKTHVLSPFWRAPARAPLQMARGRQTTSGRRSSTIPYRGLCTSCEAVLINRAQPPIGRLPSLAHCGGRPDSFTTSLACARPATMVLAKSSAVPVGRHQAPADDEFLLEGRIADDAHNLIIEPVDDRLRRAGRREQAVPSLRRRAFVAEGRPASARFGSSGVRTLLTSASAVILPAVICAVTLPIRSGRSASSRRASRRPLRRRR